MLGATGDSAYIWSTVVVAVLTIGGTGGLLGLYRWVKGQGVRDNDADEVRDAVLGPKGHPEQGLIAKVDRLLHEIQPNGGNSRQLGDTVHRIERTTTETKTVLDQHIGACNAEHASLGRQIRGLKERL